MPTNISWVRNPDGTKGETWNPVTGCTPISEGCAHCYARTFAERFRGVKGHPYEQGFDVTLHPDRLEIPLHWKKPRMVFVPSMGDLFHEDVPDEFIWDVFNVMLGAKQHTFQVLTKRPQRMKELVSGWFDPSWGKSPLPNVWLGVSVENNDNRWRLDYLRDTPAAVRFVSAEPLRGPLDLTPWLEQDPIMVRVHGPRTLDWVIVGGESGGPPERRLVEPCDCDPRRASSWGFRVARAECPGCKGTGWYIKREALEWVRDILAQCQAAGVPFFLKGWGGPTPNSGGHLLDGRLWQEMPEVRA